MVNLVYCHVNPDPKSTFPSYLYDSVYQALLIHNKYKIDEFDFKIYIITNTHFVENINETIRQFNLSGRLFVVPCEKLNMENEYLGLLPKELKEFRDGFWIHTTTRFLYISAFMERFGIDDVFHIESDVMIYENLNRIREKLQLHGMDTKIVAVQDAPSRAICSFVFIPTRECAREYANYITVRLKTGKFLNDMELMGEYTNKFHFPDSPEHPLARQFGVYDACAIGQYLGGVDFRNIPSDQIKSPFVNPTRGFINETAIFKANRAVYMQSKMNGNLEFNGKKYITGLKEQSHLDEIICLHIHSKQLYLFSSAFDIKFEDIITGDRVVAICDWVIVDREQFMYNTRLMKHNQRVILVKDFENVDIEKMNHFMEETGKDSIRLFVFIDIMPQFSQMILPFLDKRFKYTIYSHNGDYPFDKKFLPIVLDPKVEKIYAQNLDLPIEYSPKVELLPIGLARDVFPHGNLETLYKTIISTYKNSKKNSIYININESTHPFRKVVMDTVREANRIREAWPVTTQNCPFDEYLMSLSQSRFSLCLRGNGLDTHRFWESLYLGVIPVVVYHQSMNNFINHLKKQLIPFYLVDSPQFFLENDHTFFSDELYYTTLIRCGVNVSPFVCEQLKLQR